MITLLHHTFEIPYTLYMDIILSPPTQIIFPLNANFLIVNVWEPMILVHVFCYL